MDRIKKFWTTLSLTVASIMLWAPNALAQTAAADNDMSVKKYVALGATVAVVVPS